MSSAPDYQRNSGRLPVHSAIALGIQGSECPCLPPQADCLDSFFMQGTQGPAPSYPQIPDKQISNNRYQEFPAHKLLAHFYPTVPAPHTSSVSQILALV